MLKVIQECKLFLTRHSIMIQEMKK